MSKARPQAEVEVAREILDPRAALRALWLRSGRAATPGGAAFSTPEVDEEAARQFEEQVYWEDYRDRNQDDGPGRRPAVNPNQAATATADAGASGIGITDDDVPF